jgi:hypothetical protein
MDLGFVQDDGVVGDANGSGVVCVDGCALLWPTHFNEGLMDGDHFLGCGGESAKFGFGGSRHYRRHYLGDQEDRTIVLGEGVVFRDEDVGTGSTAALQFIVKTGISVNAENHVASKICGAVFGYVAK